MVKGLVAGALGFAAAFAIARVVAVSKADFERYDAMRKMSGQEPLVKELLSILGSMVAGTVQKNSVSEFIAEMTNDVVRYAKLRDM